MVVQMTKNFDPISTKQVAAILSLDFAGNNIVVNKASKFPPCEEGTLSFCNLSKDIMLSEFPSNSIIMASQKLTDSFINKGASVIISDNPKFDYCRLFHNLLPLKDYGVHADAKIGCEVILGKQVTIGSGSVLNGKIRIGDGSHIGSNVVLQNQVSIGKNVRIRNGSVIGEDAFSFGFSKNDDASSESLRFPSFGGVIIEDNVQIGNNCVISRGTFADTILRKGALINDLVHIGNEVLVSEGAIITAHTDISARVKIGKNCWIGQSAAIRQGHVIGDGAIVGMGAVVVSDVPANTTVIGIPARDKNVG